jgi:hypothetical protein
MEGHMKIEFSATIPTNLGSAIKIDGDDKAGGRLTLDIPGTDIAPLIKLTMLRGKLLVVTIEADTVEISAKE